MPYSESQKRATMKYMRENLDIIQFRVQKGQKEKIREHAETQGETLTAFIVRAIAETTERDNKKSKKK